jgi:hypothetical protein
VNNGDYSNLDYKGNVHVTLRYFYFLVEHFLPCEIIQQLISNIK